MSSFAGTVNNFVQIYTFETLGSEILTTCILVFSCSEIETNFGCQKLPYVIFNKYVYEIYIRKKHFCSILFLFCASVSCHMSTITYMVYASTLL